MSTLRSSGRRSAASDPPAVPAGPQRQVDRTDARLLEALRRDPRATVMLLANELGMSRNTIQARLAALERDGVLWDFDRRIDPAALGYPITVFVTVIVRQQLLAEVSASLAEVPEVLEVFGLSGSVDLLVRVVVKDADDLYRVAGQILALDGVERTDTSVVMRRLVDYRLTPLIDRHLAED